MESASTLIYGQSMDSLDMIMDAEKDSRPVTPFEDFVFGPHGAKSLPGIPTGDDLAKYKALVLEWIDQHGLWSEENEMPEAIPVKLFQAKRAIDLARVQLEKLNQEFNQQSVKIEKAKSQMLTKWSSSSGSQDLSKCQELDEWAKEKHHAARTPITEKENEINTREKEFECLLVDMIQQALESDPECDALVQELDQKFRALGIGDDLPAPAVAPETVIVPFTDPAVPTIVPVPAPVVAQPETVIAPVTDRAVPTTVPAPAPVVAQPKTAIVPVTDPAVPATVPVVAQPKTAIVPDTDPAVPTIVPVPPRGEVSTNVPVPPSPACKELTAVSMAFDVVSALPFRESLLPTLVI